MSMMLGAALPAPIALLVETKYAMDGGVLESDMLGGLFLEAEDPAPMRADALDQIMQEIEGLEDEMTVSEISGGSRAAAKHLDELMKLPEPLRGAAINALSAEGWRFGGLGLNRLRVAEEDGIIAELLRIEPGRAAPKHGHAGKEYSLVLRGSFQDETGSYGAGSVCVRGPADIHWPRAGREDICYALLVWEGPLVFQGLLGALQRLTRH